MATKHPTTSTTAAAASGHAACVACDAPLSGPFCAQCGQRAHLPRQTLRGFVRGAFRRVFDVERGLAHTVVRLTVDPGAVVRGYLAGRTVAYVHPLMYLLVAFAVFAVVMSLLGGTGSNDDRIFWGAAVLFVAAASRVVFVRAGLNYAEHLILNLYLFAHALLIAALGTLVGYAAPASAGAAVLLVSVAAAGVYVVWGYARVFSTRPLLAGAGALLALALGFGLWSVTLVQVVRLIRGG